MDFLCSRAPGSPPPPHPCFIPSTQYSPSPIPTSISQNAIQVSTGEALILRPVHQVEILYRGIRTTLWNPRTTLRMARGPVLPTPAEMPEGIDTASEFSLSHLLAPHLPTELGFPVFPCLVPRGSPGGLYGTQGQWRGCVWDGSLWPPRPLQVPPQGQEQPS